MQSESSATTGAEQLVVWATQPRGQPALELAGLGIELRAIEDDEGPVDRYVFGPQLAAERRTPSTFLLGIQDKTLFTSAIYLREQFETAVLIVEGRFDYEATGFHPQAIRGALSAMVVAYGISILSTVDVEETVQLLAMFARHTQIGVPEISLVPKRKAVDPADLQRRVVEMLPGCGRVAARDLLQHFGSVRRIVEATPAELQQVRGIGKQRAEEIHAVLHDDYEAVDTEQNLEDAIEADPHLLLPGPVMLVARQHRFATATGDRNVVDLVFFDSAANALVLVELKHGTLTVEHEAQVRRYLDTARESPLLAGYLDRGAGLRGVLATASACVYVPTSPDIQAVVVNRRAVIEVLKRLRAQRLAR